MGDGPGQDKRDSDQAGFTTPRTEGDISQLIVAASADGIVAVDDQGVIRVCNRAAEVLLARPAHELIGAPFGFPVVAGRAAEVELMLPGGGQRVVEMRATTATLEGQHLTIAALRDVTHRKQAERDLQAALEHQNVVVAIAAHELHNPLAAISVLAHVLQDQHDTMTSAQRARIIDQIAERTVRLQLLVRRLLTASSIDAAGVRPTFGRVPVLEIIVEQLADINAEPGEIQVSCSPGLTVIADRAEFSMMLANYLDNALTYAGPPVEIQAAEREDCAEIRVTDHGPGVPASFIPHLFERFTRAPETEHKAEGTGLGLWIVRAFAHANSGDAWYEPSGTGGSSFCLRLPLAQAPLESSAR
jgi:signal transduction histidine kinase